MQPCSSAPGWLDWIFTGFLAVQPFQSGDNDVLREMKRGYTHERYRNIIHNIRRYMPDASVSGDAIVGFPGRISAAPNIHISAPH